jgi:hypothetical protein
LFSKATQARQYDPTTTSQCHILDRECPALGRGGRANMADQVGFGTGSASQDRSSGEVPAASCWRSAGPAEGLQIAVIWMPASSVRIKEIRIPTVCIARCSAVLLPLSSRQKVWATTKLGLLFGVMSWSER